MISNKVRNSNSYEFHFITLSEFTLNVQSLKGHKRCYIEKGQGSMQLITTYGSKWAPSMFNAHIGSEWVSLY